MLVYLISVIFAVDLKSNIGKINFLTRDRFLFTDLSEEDKGQSLPFES